MRIMHVCLCAPYTDGMAYQENELVTAHRRAGHEVTILAPPTVYGNDRTIVPAPIGESITSEGARLLRLPYRELGHPFLKDKIRSFRGVEEALETYRPQAILFHGLTAWELRTVSRWAKRRPHVALYADCHEDFNNSARTFLSRWGLHYLFYRPVLRAALPALRKVLCVSLESIDFAAELYGVPREHLEFYPLGGEVLSDETYTSMREATRTGRGWRPEHVVFLQSGKIDRAKRLADSLRAFAAVEGEHLRFVVAGQLMPDIAAEIGTLMRGDPRVSHLGWVAPDTLRALLCGADVYVQPGSQSATLQMAMCCRRPVVAADVPSHRALVSANGMLVHDATGLYAALASLANDKRQREAMSVESGRTADRLLDYRILAQRVLE